jgi:uncharacterized membrane protein
VGVFFNRLDKWVPHVHCDRLNALSLFRAHLVKKTDQGLGLAIFANKQHPAAEVIDDHGQIPVASANRDFIDGQDLQPV